MKATPAKKLFGKPSAHTKARMKKWMMTGLIYAIVLSVETVNAMPLFGEAEELHCGYEEHKHTDTCYEKDEPCDILEHEHSDQCYSDPKADVESSPMDSVKVKLTGKYSTDLAAIAEEQVGYKESADNFKTGSNDERFGYTRYGAWYENPYQENWSAWFVSFCMEAAGIDFIQPKDRALLIQKQIDGLLDEKEAEPVEENEEIVEESAEDNSNADLNSEEEEIIEDEEILETEEAIEEVVPEEETAPEQETETEADPAKEPEADPDEEKLFTDESDYVPHVGDLIFLNREGEADGVINHIGIVTKLHKNKQDEVERITAVEGDVEGEVVSKEYNLTEDTDYIKGFGQISKKDKADIDIETLEEEIKETEDHILTYENSRMRVEAVLEDENNFPKDARLSVTSFEEENDRFQEAIGILNEHLNVNKSDSAENIEEIVKTSETEETVVEDEADSDQITDLDKNPANLQEEVDPKSLEIFDFSVLDSKGNDLEPEKGKIQFNLVFKDNQFELSNQTEIHHIVDPEKKEIESITPENLQEEADLSFSLESLSTVIIAPNGIQMRVRTVSDEDTGNNQSISLQSTGEPITFSHLLDKLSGVINYGLVAEKFDMSGDMETNMAVNEFVFTGTNKWLGIGAGQYEASATSFKITINKVSNVQNATYYFGLYADNGQTGQKIRINSGLMDSKDNGNDISQSIKIKTSNKTSNSGEYSGSIDIYGDWNSINASKLYVYELSGNQGTGEIIDPTSSPNKQVEAEIDGITYTVKLSNNQTCVINGNEIQRNANYNFINEIKSPTKQVTLRNNSVLVVNHELYKCESNDYWNIDLYNGDTYVKGKDGSIIKIALQSGGQAFEYPSSKYPTPNITQELKSLSDFSKELAVAQTSEDVYVANITAEEFANSKGGNDINNESSKNVIKFNASKGYDSKKHKHILINLDMSYVKNDVFNLTEQIKIFLDNTPYEIISSSTADNIAASLIINPIKRDGNTVTPYGGQLNLGTTGGIYIAPEANVTIFPGSFAGAVYAKNVSQDKSNGESHPELHRLPFGRVLYGEVTWENKKPGHPDEPEYELPSTGGSGTLFYTMSGLFLTSMAAGALFILKKRQNRLI